MKFKLISKIVILIVGVYFVFHGAFMAYRDIIRPEVIKHQVLTSTGWGQKNKKLRSQKINKNSVVFVGNSLTERFDLSVFNNNHLVNNGIGGDLTEGVLNRINELVTHHPDKIFLQIGINDILANVSTTEMKTNYLRIVNILTQKAPDTEVYIQSILPVKLNNTFWIRSDYANERIIETNIYLNDLSRIQSIKFINLHPHFFENGELKADLTNDGVHLTNNGYLLWEKLLKPLIN